MFQIALNFWQRDYRIELCFEVKVHYIARYYIAYYVVYFSELECVEGGTLTL